MNFLVHYCREPFRLRLRDEPGRIEPTFVTPFRKPFFQPRRRQGPAKENRRKSDPRLALPIRRKCWLLKAFARIPGKATASGKNFLPAPSSKLLQAPVSLVEWEGNGGHALRQQCAYLQLNRATPNANAAEGLLQYLFKAWVQLLAA